MMKSSHFCASPSATDFNAQPFLAILARLYCSSPSATKQNVPLAIGDNYTSLLMPQSLFKILAHIVFSTKNRVEIITPEIEPDLYSFIGGILKNNKSKLLAANGTANHIHLLVSLGKTISLSELVGDIKRDSSVWIKDRGRKFENFYWQDGYGAFSIGQSQIATVKNYIARQKVKHQKVNFQTEFRDFLKKYEVEYDEQYVWR